jgi:putative transposase
VTVFGFIAAKKAEHAVSTLCRVLGVSRSGYHAWERREPSRRTSQDASLTTLIGRIHEDSRRTYGSPRVHAELRLEHGIRVGRKRVERLMRQAELSGQLRRRRGRTTIRVRGVRTAPDLVQRDFDPAGPNRLWCADITCLRTWEGWLYLASVMDCWSRRIVGWSIADHLRAELVVDALEMAVARRRPDAGVIHHSDAGGQYVSLIFTRRCRAVGIEISMGQRGDCFDNSVLESFHATLKKDLVHRRSWPTKAEARTAVFEYIEAFYNRRRRHSRLGMQSPVDFENTIRADGPGLAASRLASPDTKITTTTEQRHAA